LFGFRFEDERGVTHSGFGNQQHQPKGTTSYSIQDKEFWTRLYATAAWLGEQCSFWLPASQRSPLAYYLFKPALTASSAEQKLKFNFGRESRSQHFDENSSLLLFSKSRSIMVNQFNVAPIGPNGAEVSISG